MKRQPISVLLLAIVLLVVPAVGAATYREGQQALDAGRWADAAGVFGEVAAANGVEADAALYWQAYALAKDGKKAEALAVLRELPARHPDSDWLDDARALELELRGPRSAAGGDIAEDEELKLYALNGLMHADPDRALPVLRKFLEGDASPQLKKQALFVLGQSGTPEARQLLEFVATGKSHPDLRIEAIEMLGIAGNGASTASLSRIYRESRDPEVRRAVLHAYLVANAVEEVLTVARGDEEPAMRRRAIQQLGAMRAGAALEQLYSQERSVENRRTILQAMGIAGEVEALAQAARSETDAGLRRDAIHGLGITSTPAAGAALEDLYATHTDAAIREAVVHALFIQDNAKALIRLFRTEKDPGLRRQIVKKLSLMDSPESTALLLEMLDQ